MSSHLPFVIIEHDPDHGRRLLRLMELLVPTCLYTSCQDHDARARVRRSRGLIARESCLTNLGHSKKAPLEMPILLVPDPDDESDTAAQKDPHASGVRAAVAEPSARYEREVACSTWPLLISRRPVRPEVLFAFIRMALGDQDEGRFRLVCVLEAYARRKGLSARQIELSVMAALGADRQHMIDVLSISPNTLKSEVRHLLRKCDASSLDDLGRALLRESLLGRDELGTRDGSPRTLLSATNKPAAD